MAMNSPNKPTGTSLVKLARRGDSFPIPRPRLVEVHLRNHASIDPVLLRQHPLRQLHLRHNNAQLF